MKIVYISSSTIPSRAANSIHVMKMCQAFAHNGHEVVLVTPDKKSDLELNVNDVFEYYGVEKNFTIEKVSWLPLKGRGYIYGWLAARLASNHSPDVVFCRNLNGCFFSAILGLNVIYESHSPIVDSGKASEWLFKQLIKRAQLLKLIVITNSLKDYYESGYRSIKGKIQVAPDGADQMPENIDRIELPNLNTRLQVGYVGHLYKGRGVELIVELAKRCPWADFHLVGGTERDINYWQVQIGNLENIRLHGFVAPATAERYRATFDVLLAPYQNELSTAGGNNTVRWMSPLKIFEYMAARKPIIASDIDVLREVLVHEENALLCQPDKVKDWQDALELLNESKHLREYLATNAYEVFIKSLTWKARSISCLPIEYGK